MNIQPGCLCRSLAGNDRNHYYIILADKGAYVVIADGRKLTAANPGRKNKKHIQAEKTPVVSGDSLTDEAMKSITALRLGGRTHVKSRRN